MDSRWNLSEIFATDGDFNTEAAALDTEIFPAFRARMQTVDSPESLAVLFGGLDAITRRVNHIQSYASQKADLDARDPAAAAQRVRAQNIFVDYSLIQSSLRSFLLSKDRSFWDALLSAPALIPWRRTLGLIQQRAGHCLSDGDEALLAPSNEALNNIQNVFTTLSYSEMPWRTVQDPDGREVMANYANYSHAMHSPDRAYRETYYRTFLGTVSSYAGTFAQNLSSYAILSEQLARQHRYASLLDSQMQQSELDPSVYECLIEGARANSGILRREFDIRRRALGFDRLYTWDKVAPIGKTAAPSYSYEDAQRAIEGALSVLGTDYVSTLKKAFSEGWIDLCPAPAKATGAYSGGAIDIHPWILSNFTGDYGSVSTLAHELGHAVHQARSYAAQKSEASRDVQPLSTEVCSIANEILLADWLIGQAASPGQKLFFVQQELNLLRNTFFSQVFYADFEREYHRFSEKNEALTARALSSLYLKISAIYYPGYEQAEPEASFWALIPHFYYNYYLYSYAVDVCAACSVAGRIAAGDRALLASYQRFLSAGSSQSSIELFRTLGIDLTGPGYIRALTDRFAALLDIEESLIGV